MAPRTRNNDIKKQRQSRKREVRFPRREVPVKKSATIIRPPQNYENLILYYLTKLKRLFSNTSDHPHAGVRENSADKMRREQLEARISKTSELKINHNKYTASHTAPKPHEEVLDSPSAIKDKVFNVVNAAIEYGFANDVLERKGDCFMFKNKRYSKVANRQATPGPSAIKRSYCSQCSCSNCKNYNDNNKVKDSRRPMSENNATRKLSECGNGNGSIHESKTQHPLAGGSRSSQCRRSSRSKSCTIGSNHFKSRLRRICTCAKCRALEQRRRIQRK